MSDINNCTFTGRLGFDPETRTFPSGDSVTNARIAVGRQWKNKDTNEREERTEWVSLVFRGGLAGVAGQYLRKGSQVAVSGEFRTRKWSDKDGNERYSTEIHVKDMTMLGGRQDASEKAHAEKPVKKMDDLSDIPF